MSQAKTGILLANLGTPEAPTSDAVKRYLRQFLSDTRVVDFPRLLWWPLLRGVILPIRSPRVAKLYQSVWMEEGSPLMVYSRRQEKALAARLPDMPVALGMSYGKPSLKSAVESLLAQGVDHIVVLALYPQYSCSTVAAVWDELALGLPPEKVMMTFQSRFGREPWLTPYTDETLKMLGEKGVKHIQVMSPGFSADCLETLEEIAVQNREFFLEAGGEKYEYIPALNDSPEHIDMMVSLVTNSR